MSTPKVTIVVAALFLVVVLSWLYLGTREATITNYPSSGTDVVAFGDSLIEGVGSTNGHDFVSKLSDRMRVKIVNLGHSGDTTADGLARVSALDSYHPKVVILLLGGNDYLKRIPPAETFSNLSRIIEDIQSRGSIVLLLGVRGGVLSDHFAPEFEKLHQKYGTAYVDDVLKGVFGHAELLSDTVHPNDAGYAVIAERVAPVLSRLLK